MGVATARCLSPHADLYPSATDALLLRAARWRRQTGARKCDLIVNKIARAWQTTRHTKPGQMHRHRGHTKLIEGDWCRSTPKYKKRARQAHSLASPAGGPRLALRAVPHACADQYTPLVIR